MFGTLARHVRFVIAHLDGERIDFPTLLVLAIERSNDLLLRRFSKGG